jgi:hypothetical protein
MRIHRPSPAVILAGLALFVALGGTAAAAHHFLITSTRQIKPSVIRALRADAPRGPAGPAGPSGPQGPAGTQGPAGPSNLSALTIVRAPDQVVKPTKEATSIATCPAGSHVVSGGEYSGFATRNGSEMSTDHQSWIVLVTNLSGIEINLEAIAYCAGAGQAVAASVPRGAHLRAVRQAQAMLTRLRSERLAATPAGAPQALPTG